MASTYSKSNQQSAQVSQSSQNQNYGSNQSTATTGGFDQYTNSHSTTNYSSHTEGGANSKTTGRSWASGQVDAPTQQRYTQYNSQDYAPSENVQAAYQRLQNTIAGKPGEFNSPYQAQLDNLYSQIMNGGKFQYNFNADPMYQMYKDQYQTAGRQAMQSTMGQQAALTGGYASSYAQSAGQQAYQGYLQQLNQVIPTLRDQAYQYWADEQNRLRQNYELAGAAEDRAYGRYRDAMSDWQVERGYDTDLYQNERNFDWSQYAANREYTAGEYWNQRNAEHSNESETNERNWSDTVGHSTTDTMSHTYGTSWENAISEGGGWSNSIGNDVTNSTGSSESFSGSVPTGGSSAATYAKVFKEEENKNKAKNGGVLHTAGVRAVPQ